MKRTLAAVILGLACAMTATAQTYPAVMTIVAREVEVRSGPTKEYHPTMKLPGGSRVLVRRQSKDQPGWLAIAPPQGSFSWINAKYVKQIDAKTGYVVGAANEEIQLLPGSSLVNAPPNTVSIKVKPGYQFAILGPPTTAEGQSWLPITPHPDEDRFLPLDAVGGALASVSTGSPPAGKNVSANPLIAQADQAYLTGQLDRARQLYKEAADKTDDFQQKSYCYNRLASLSKGSWGSNPPGHPEQAKGPPTQLTSLTNPNPPSGSANQFPPNWSKWGTLRSTVFDKDGQPMYVLENERGQPILYVTTSSGFSLKGYVGKQVSLYGPMSYHNQIRAYYMTASHVAENRP